MEEGNGWKRESLIEKVVGVNKVDALRVVAVVVDSMYSLGQVKLWANLRANPCPAGSTLNFIISVHSASPNSQMRFVTPCVCGE